MATIFFVSIYVVVCVSVACAFLKPSYGRPVGFLYIDEYGDNHVYDLGLGRRVGYVSDMRSIEISTQIQLRSGSLPS